MNRSSLKWLDQVPTSGLAIGAVLLGLAPFQPQPHLLEKARMLLDGTLSRPIDIFDLLFHGAPLALLAIQLLRRRSASRRGESPDDIA